MFPLRFCFVPGSIPKCPQMPPSAGGTARFQRTLSSARDSSYACGKLLSFRSRIISASSTSAFRASEEGIHHGGQNDYKCPILPSPYPQTFCRKGGGLFPTHETQARG